MYLLLFALKILAKMSPKVIPLTKDCTAPACKGDQIHAIKSGYEIPAGSYNETFWRVITFAGLLLCPSLYYSVLISMGQINKSVLNSTGGGRGGGWGGGQALHTNCLLTVY